MRVAIVGAGVMGLAAAAAIARRGHDVEVHEQFDLWHTRGSSHGNTRIFRLAYPEPEWVQLAQEALPLWRELERETGTQLLALDGLLELGATSATALAACGVRFEELASDEVERRFGVRVSAPALLQPDAGYVRADAARRAFVARAGLRVRERSAVTDVEDVDADVVVVTAGAWASKLIELPVTVTRETVVYFRIARPTVPSLVEYPRGPGAAMYALHDPVYGLKAGAHMSGIVVDPETPARPDDAVVDAVREWVVERFADVDPDPAALETCLYTTTADERFILERRGRIVVGSPCSGHGFKFAPAIGERLAELATG